MESYGTFNECSKIYQDYVNHYREESLDQFCVKLGLSQLNEVMKESSSQSVQPIDYLRTLITLTMVDEIQVALDIAKYDLRGVKLNFTSYRYEGKYRPVNTMLQATVKIPGSSESRPRVLVGDMVRLRPAKEEIQRLGLGMIEMHAVVVSYSLAAEEAVMVVSLPNVFPRPSPTSHPEKYEEMLVRFWSGVKFYLRFSYDHSYFAFSYFTLNYHVIADPYLLDCLFPKSELIETLTELRSKTNIDLKYLHLDDRIKCNEQQMQSIEDILVWCGTDRRCVGGTHSKLPYMYLPLPPFILFGPPGTGLSSVE